MPVFRTRVALDLIRNVRAFLNVEGGVTHGTAAETVKESPSAAPEEKRDTSVSPESLVWIFGSGKTGSTWLSHMMADLEGYRLWAEPDVGKLFGGSCSQADTRRIFLISSLLV